LSARYPHPSPRLAGLFSANLSIAMAPLRFSPTATTPSLWHSV